MPKFFKQNLLTSEHLLPKPEDQLPEHSSTPSQPSPDQKYFDDEDDDYMIRDLLTWTSPARPYRKKDRSYFTLAITLVILVSLIGILWFGTVLLAGALLALLFVAFVLDRVPPENIDHKISTQGITISNHFYHWYDLDSFWLGEKDDNKILYVRTHFRFPSVLMLVLDPISEDQVKKICARFLPFQEIAPKSFLDDWAKQLQKHFPLEAPHH